MSFLQNLWRDLVDKRLWPVALALVLAAVAVPFLIDSGTSVPASEAAAVAQAPSTQSTAEVAVAVTPTEARDRTGKARDPFKALVFEKAKESAAGGDAQSSSAAAAAAAKDAGVAASSGTRAPASGSGAKAGGGTGKAPDTTPTDTSPRPPTSTTTTRTRLLSYSLALQIRRSGRVFSRRGVRAVSFLPSSQNPLIAFIGVRSDGVTPSFLVSDGVEVLNSSPVCRPSKTTCRIADVKPGESILVARRPAIGQPIKRFRILVQDVALTAVPKRKPTAKRARARTTRSATAASADPRLADVLDIDLAPTRSVDITRTTR